MKLTSAQKDRAAGVLLGQAIGDALGVPYEFAMAPLPATGAVMEGGGLGGYEPGEWSDDTQMAITVARVTAGGADLTSEDGLEILASDFLDWKDNGATDIGLQTSAVLDHTRREFGELLAPAMTAAAQAYVQATGVNGGAGNGALMRSGVIGLATLFDRVKTADAAVKVAVLTHPHHLSVDAAVLWSEAVRVAVLDGRLDLRGGLDLLPAERVDQWAAWIDEAETASPSQFGRNTSAVSTVQAAWSSITRTQPLGSPDRYHAALQAAIAIGNDTDTVAAVTGALIGGFVGWSGIPTDLTRRVHGWPRMRAYDLIGLALRTAGTVDRWPTSGSMLRRTGGEPLGIPHPHDPGVLLGTEHDLVRASELGVTAVVSLSRVGAADVAASGIAPGRHVLVRLIDSNDPAANPHLAWTLADAAGTMKQLRDEGETVLLHCIAAEHRVPAVAVAYSRRLGHGPDEDWLIAKAVEHEVTGLLWDTAHELPLEPSVTSA